jgi:hypothetical protein
LIWADWESVHEALEVKMSHLLPGIDAEIERAPTMLDIPMI